MTTTIDIEYKAELIGLITGQITEAINKLEKLMDNELMTWAESNRQEQQCNAIVCTRDAIRAQALNIPSVASRSPSLVTDATKLVQDFTENVKDTLKEIFNPTLLKVYKLDPNAKGGFETHLEYNPNPKTIQEEYQFPTLPDVTKEQWLECQKDVEEGFKQDYLHSSLYFNKHITEKEDLKNQWLKNPLKQTLIIDEEIINMAQGFMVGPCGLYKGKAVMAGTQKFDSLAEMKIFLKVQCKNQDMVLYTTFGRGGAYYWRGAFLDKVALSAQAS